MTVLVIPSAKFVGLDLRMNYGSIPPVLVPLGGTVALRSIVNLYGTSVERTYVLVDEGAEMVEDYLAFFADPTIEVVRVTSGVSLADSLLDAVAKRPEIAESSVVLNLGDTVVRDLDLSLVGSDFCVYGETSQTERWTLFRRDSAGDLEISDKDYQSDPETWSTFLGVWGFERFGRFLDLVRTVVGEGSPPAGQERASAFYEAFRRYVPEADVDMRPASSWVDYGHLDNLNAARQKSMNLRSFNSLQFLHGGATVRKQSTNTAKLRDEIRWLLNTPRDLKVFTPTVYDQSLDPSTPYVEMEFYAYPSLDESFVYSRHDYDTWERIFQRVFHILDLQQEYSIHEPDLALDLRAMYVGKTFERLERFIESGRFPATLRPRLGGVELPSLEDVSEQLEGVLEATGALRASSFSMGHGDLCFGNILYDAHHDLIKLIDPRGRFGRQPFHGDIYYELAKLSHSVLGFYDFLMFDQFAVTGDPTADTKFEVAFRTKPYHEKIGSIFEKHLLRNGYDLRRSRIIESTLFLSMLPLHAENPTRQLAMLLRGLDLFRMATGEA